MSTWDESAAIRARLLSKPPDRSPREIELVQPRIVRPMAASARSAVPSTAPSPQRLITFEPPTPLSAINDDPVFEMCDAATILGVKIDCLKKWRQRDEGPHFIQYEGPGGPVRYALSALMAYREQCTIRPSNARRRKSK